MAGDPVLGDPAMAALTGGDPAMAVSGEDDRVTTGGMLGPGAPVAPEGVRAHGDRRVRPDGRQGSNGRAIARATNMVAVPVRGTPVPPIEMVGAVGTRARRLARHLRQGCSGAPMSRICHLTWIFGLSREG